jgi:hypothetical protein
LRIKETPHFRPKPKARCHQVQYYRNRTATPGEELHQIAPDCTKLHQIAPNCGCAKKSKGRKPGRKKGIPPQAMGDPPSLSRNDAVGAIKRLEPSTKSPE